MSRDLQKCDLQQLNSSTRRASPNFYSVSCVTAHNVFVALLAFRRARSVCDSLPNRHLESTWSQGWHCFFPARREGGKMEDYFRGDCCGTDTCLPGSSCGVVLAKIIPKQSVIRRIQGPITCRIAVLENLYPLLFLRKQSKET